jgi:DnaJ family protein A protein 5
MFVRKRDPRYKAHTKRQAQSPTPTPATASGTTTPKRTAPTTTFVVQDWQKVAEPSDAAADLEWARAEGTDDEEWECIACNKTFRSEAAWNSHERSKKHIRTVEQLKREMLDEELELELGPADGAFADAGAEEADGQITASAAAAGDEEPQKASPDRRVMPTPDKEEATTEAQDSENRPGRRRRTQNKSHTPSEEPSPAASVPEASQIGAARPSSAHQHQTESDPELPREFRETLNLGEPHNDEDTKREGDETSAANSTKVDLSKREKRRAREAAKMAREVESKSSCAVSFPHQILLNSPPCWATRLEFAASVSSALGHYSFGHVLFFFCCHSLVTDNLRFSEQCNVCGENFDSRTRLFEHVNREGHALADPRDGNIPKKKGKKTR